MQLSSLLLLLGLAASPAVANPIDLTNAERIQRGLPLKVPARHYDPSRTRQLSARASTVPVTQAQTPGSAFIQVEQQQPGGRKRQTTTTLGYLSYNALRGTFQVGTTGSAVSFAPPMPNTLDGGIKISSPDLFGQNICASTTPTGPNGKAAATSFVAAANPPQGSDFGTVRCFFWKYTRQTLDLSGRDRLTRDAYTFAVDPVTSDLYAWTGTAEADLPPAANRVTLTVVYQSVPQPTGLASYQAVMRLQFSGNTDYFYAQWREFTNFAGFYLGPLSEATIFTVSPASTNSSRSQFQFTHQGVLKTVALSTSRTEDLNCQQDAYNCRPSTQLIATPSIYDARNPLYLTDVFTYPSYVKSVNGVVAKFKVGAAEGRTIESDFDVGFYASGASISTFTVDPTGYYGVFNQLLTIDLIPQ